METWNNLTISITMIVVVSVVFAGIGVLVWLDQRGKTVRRELENQERMLALERGLPLDDAAITRYRTLGAIALTVPIVAFVVALTTTSLMFAFKEQYDWPWWLLTVIWGVAGIVSVVTVATTVGRMDRPGRGRWETETTERKPDGQ